MRSRESSGAPMAGWEVEVGVGEVFGALSVGGGTALAINRRRIVGLGRC